MWLQLLLLLVGFVALVWSADKFLSGAASAAVNFGIPKIIIGLTIVSLGTSAPEIVVATFQVLLDEHQTIILATTTNHQNPSPLL